MSEFTYDALGELELDDGLLVGFSCDDSDRLRWQLPPQTASISLTSYGRAKPLLHGQLNNVRTSWRGSSLLGTAAATPSACSGPDKCKSDAQLDRVLQTYVALIKMSAGFKNDDAVDATHRALQQSWSGLQYWLQDDHKIGTIPEKLPVTISSIRSIAGAGLMFATSCRPARQLNITVVRHCSPAEEDVAWLHVWACGATNKSASSARHRWHESDSW